jgi:putative endonuclease
MLRAVILRESPCDESKDLHFAPLLQLQIRSQAYNLAMQDRYYVTYIVASRSLTLYIGMTGNLHKRVFEHKTRLHEGFSATYNCNRLVRFERFIDPSNAIQREKQLKGWTRTKKIALIRKTNPTLTQHGLI